MAEGNPGELGFFGCAWAAVKHVGGSMLSWLPWGLGLGAAASVAAPILTGGWSLLAGGTAGAVMGSAGGLGSILGGGIIGAFAGPLIIVTGICLAIGLISGICGASKAVQEAQAESQDNAAREMARNGNARAVQQGMGGSPDAPLLAHGTHGRGGQRQGMAIN